MRRLLPLIVVGLLVVPTPARAHTIERIPIQQTVFVTQCLGPDPYVIALSGELTVITHFEEPGVWYLQVQNWRFTGVGVSDGVQYVGGITRVNQVRIDQNGQHHTFVATTRFTSKGSHPNWRFKALVRFTLFASGPATHPEIISFRLVCTPPG